MPNSKRNVTRFALILNNDFQKQVGHIEIADEFVSQIDSIEHLLISPLWNRNGIIAFSVGEVPETKKQNVRKCGLCDHEINDTLINQCGFASVTEGEETIYLCHADDHSCYRRWTIWDERPDDVLKEEPEGTLEDIMWSCGCHWTATNGLERTCLTTSCVRVIAKSSSELREADNEIRKALATRSTCKTCGSVVVYRNGAIGKFWSHEDQPIDFSHKPEVVE